MARAMQILTDCDECAGTGEILECHGYRYVGGDGGPWVPDEEEYWCRECRGTGQVVDPDFVLLYSDLLPLVPRNCPRCGPVTLRPPFRWWPLVGGWVADCGGCGSSLLLPADAVQQFHDAHESYETEAGHR